MNDDAFGILHDARHIVLRFVKRRNATVLPHRTRAGVVGRKRVVQSVAGQSAHQSPVHAIERGRGMNGIDRVPNIRDTVTVTVDAVLLPSLRHELRDALRARR